MNNNSRTNNIERFFSDYKSTITVISGFLIVVTFFITADDYINTRIEEKITDETYINNLALVLRPFALFDQKGVIQYDHGAVRYIKEIDIEEKGYRVKSVVITTREYLKNPPILQYKDEIMMNALPQIRRQGTAGSSYIEMNDERLDYELRHQNTDHLDCELVVARVKNRDQWPTLAGQWITAGSQRFYILDYWREE